MFARSSLFCQRPFLLNQLVAGAPLQSKSLLQASQTMNFASRMAEKRLYLKKERLVMPTM